MRPGTRLHHQQQHPLDLYLLLQAACILVPDCITNSSIPWTCIYYCKLHASWYQTASPTAASLGLVFIIASCMPPGTRLHHQQQHPLDLYLLLQAACLPVPDRITNSSIPWTCIYYCKLHAFRCQTASPTAASLGLV